MYVSLHEIPGSNFTHLTFRRSLNKAFHSQDLLQFDPK
jgi:hypothetical protein